MKKVLCSLLFVCCCLVSCSKEVPTIKVDNETYIDITLNTLSSFKKQSMSEWQKVMEKYGYELMNDDGDVCIYRKGSFEIGKQHHVISKSRTANDIAIE